VSSLARIIDNIFYRDIARGRIFASSASAAPPMRPSEALTLHRAALRQLLNRYGFRQPRVFGSVLTRTDTEESDLDVLVEPVRGTTLFTLAGLEDEARQLTGVRVSVLTPGFLSPKFRDKVLQQAQPL
jgi:predicted nucleotidyltransferase